MLLIYSGSEIFFALSHKTVFGGKYDRLATGILLTLELDM